MKAEIITVGSELLIGDTVDTHSSFLSRQCLHMGISVQYHTSVSDDQKQMLELFRLASNRSDLIIVCGGLGPTMDDQTKETLSQFLGIELVLSEEIKKQIQHRFIRRNQRQIPPNNYKQAYVFPQGIVFPNDHGTAPGLAVTKNCTTYVLLPGPPKELIPMFEKYVQPYLSELVGGKQVLLHTDLSFFGLGESILEERIKDLIKQADNPRLATYIHELSVVVRITGKGKSKTEVQQKMDQCKRKIYERIGDYCYSEQKETIEEVVVKKLSKLQKTVAFAESCTGGLLAHYVSTVPGSSAVFCGGFISYTNQAKEKLKLVSPTELETNGAVHWQTAKSMAEETQKQFNADFALSVTGVAGPQTLDHQPVGTVFIGFAEKGAYTNVYQFRFHGTRQTIQQWAARYALFILLQRLKKGEVTS